MDEAQEELHDLQKLQGEEIDRASRELDKLENMLSAAVCKVYERNYEYDIQICTMTLLPIEKI